MGPAASRVVEESTQLRYEEASAACADKVQGQADGKRLNVGSGEEDGLGLSGQVKEVADAAA